jgi:hypothetical protein
MDDLYFNLASEEFSKSRKILIWIIAVLTALVAAWDSYLKFFKHDASADLGLTFTLYVITIFLFSIAILSTKKRKEHFFKVDKEQISYHYGLLFPSHRSYLWSDVREVYLPPHSKNTVLILTNDKPVHINLTWVERNKSRIIRKHIYYLAKEKGIGIFKKHYKK